MTEILDFLRFVLIVLGFGGLAYYSAIAYANLIKFMRIKDAEASRFEAETRLVWLEAAKREADIDLVPASPNGHLPVARRLLANGSLITDQLHLISQEIDTRRPVQPVPQSLSYAPHFARVDAPTKVDLDGESPQLAVATNSNFWSLWTAGELPDNGFLMGHNLSDGAPVYADWKKLYSALIGGQSGSGKSTLIRNVLTQSAIQGGRFIVLDKHYAAGEESLGASLYPLRSRLMCDIAATDKQMTEAIKLMRHIGAQRLAGKDGDKSPVILVVDETTALLSRSDIADELKHLLGEIAQETRKVGVYALCIGQNFHSKIMDTTVRNSFVSYLSCRTRPDVARVMAGSNEFGKIAGELRTGQCVWMDTNGEMVRIAVPNTTQKHVEMVAREIDGSPLGTTGSTSGSEVVPSGTVDNEIVHCGTSQEPAPEPLVEPASNIVSDAVKVRMVRDMMANCAGVNEIIRQVWGVQSKGRAYQSASAELNQIMAHIARSAS